LVLKEKIFKYLQTHKKAVTSRQLADRFLSSATSVATVLRKLEGEGLAYSKTVNGKKFWSLNRSVSDTVAVSEEHVVSQPSRSPTIVPQRRPIQNSYPNVRGYDD